MRSYLTGLGPSLPHYKDHGPPLDAPTYLQQHLRVEVRLIIIPYQDAEEISRLVFLMLVFCFPLIWALYNSRHNLSSLEICSQPFSDIPRA